MLHKSNGDSFYGNSDCFIFMLEPKENKFEVEISEQLNIVFACSEYFSFGNGDEGVAFSIDCEIG